MFNAIERCPKGTLLKGGLVVSAFGALAANCFAPIYMNYGPTDGETVATALDARGGVATGYSLVGGAPTSFKFSPESGLIYLGTGPNSRGLAVSGDGSVFVGFLPERGFIAGPEGLHSLPLPSPDFASTSGLGEAWLGNMQFGFSMSKPGTQPAHSVPTFWREGRGFIIPDIGSAVSSDATMRMIIGTTLDTSGFHAVEWKRNVAGGFDRMFFATPGGKQSAASAISCDGSTAAGAIFTVNPLTGARISPTAAIWDTATMAVTPLADLPGGTGFTEANAVTCDGSVVVGSELDSSGHPVKAMYWDSDRMPHDLAADFVAGGGNLQGTLPIQIGGVSEDGFTFAGTAMIAGGHHRGFLLRLDAPLHISFMMGYHNSVIGGTQGGGRVRLSGPAPNGGTMVNLSTEDPNIHLLVPAVQVAAGQQEATFYFNTDGVSAPETGLIFGDGASSHSMMAVEIQRARFTKGIVSIPSETGGRNFTVSAVLTGKAGPTGFLIGLLFGNPEIMSAAGPLVVPPQQQFGSTIVKTKGVDTDTLVTIRMSDGQNIINVTNTVLAAGLDHLTVGNASVVGGNPGQVYAYLNGLAGPSGKSVAMSSSSPLLTVPASLPVSAQHYVGYAAFETSGVSASTPVTITGNLNSVSKTVTVTLVPAVQREFIGRPNPVKGGNDITFTVTFNGKTPASGGTLTIATNNAALANVPSTVTVPGNVSYFSFVGHTKHVSANTSVSFQSVYNGSPKYCTVTLTP